MIKVLRWIGVMGIPMGLWMVLVMFALTCQVQAQPVNPETVAHQPKLNKKLGLGVFGHFDGRLVTGFCEFRLLPRLMLEPNIGFIRFQRRDFTFASDQKVVFTKFSMGADVKYYFLFNRRHPLEGIYAAFHGSFFRFNTYATKDEYKPLRMYHSKAGVGIGGNYYFYKRFSVGATVYLCYTKGADVLMNPNGTIRRIYRRSGFVLPFSFQVGLTF